MTAVELLTSCRQAGIRLEAAGDRLRYEAPPGSLTPELRDTLAQYKTELLSLLAAPQRFVTLRAGETLPRTVVELAWSLEDRGFALTVTADGDLTVTPVDALTEQDRSAIARWRSHLTALTAYCDEEAM